MTRAAAATTTDEQSALITELADLVKAQETALRNQVDAALQRARAQKSVWHVEHAFWIARHMRTRTAYLAACWLAAQVLTELGPKEGGETP